MGRRRCRVAWNVTDGPEPGRQRSSRSVASTSPGRFQRKATEANSTALFGWFAIGSTRTTRSSPGVRRLHPDLDALPTQRDARVGAVDRVRSERDRLVVGAGPSDLGAAQRRAPVVLLESESQADAVRQQHLRQHAARVPGVPARCEPALGLGVLGCYGPAPSGVVHRCSVPLCRPIRIVRRPPRSRSGCRRGTRTGCGRRRYSKPTLERSGMKSGFGSNPVTFERHA